MEWEKYYEVARLSFQKGLIYKESFLITLFFAPFGALLQFLVWTSVLPEATQGYTSELLVGYFVLTWILLILYYDNWIRTMGRQVRDGELTRIVLRPFNHLQYMIAEKLGNRFLAVFLECIPLLLITGAMFGFGIFAGTVSLYAVALFFEGLIIFSLTTYVFGLSAFWLTRTRSIVTLYWALAGLLGGNLAPLVFYPEWLQGILFYLPFQYVYYAPVAAFQGNYALAGFTAGHAALYALAIIAALLILKHILANAAFKRYSGAGQ